MICMSHIDNSILSSICNSLERLHVTIEGDGVRDGKILIIDVSEHGLNQTKLKCIILLLIVRVCDTVTQTSVKE